MSDQNIESQMSDSTSSDSNSSSIPEVVARIASVDEALAAEVADRYDRIEELETALEERDDRIEELEHRLKRERADFQNFKKRSQDREEQARERAVIDLIEQFIEVRDNLDRALEQESDADIRDGVEATRDGFDTLLENENVDRIEPDPGDAVDPTIHEVVMRVNSDRPAGQIDEVYRPGYSRDDTVIRPAQVAVSDGPAEESESETTTAADETDTTDPD